MTEWRVTSNAIWRPRAVRTSQRLTPHGQFPLMKPTRSHGAHSRRLTARRNSRRLAEGGGLSGPSVGKWPGAFVTRSARCFESFRAAFSDSFEASHGVPVKAPPNALLAFSFL